MAVVFAEYAPPGADVSRAILQCLVHDVVEIDAGDTFAYDQTGYGDKAERERVAATRLFGLLPLDQGIELRALWEEFEEHETPTARFANALDRMQPLLANLATGGGSWRAAGVTRSRVRRRMEPIELGCPTLWPWVCAAIERATADGMIHADAESAG
jgi:putative hydrolase of HD superfamily